MGGGQREEERKRERERKKESRKGGRDGGRKMSSATGKVKAILWSFFHPKISAFCIKAIIFIIPCLTMGKWKYREVKISCQSQTSSRDENRSQAS